MPPCHVFVHTTNRFSLLLAFFIHSFFVLWQVLFHEQVKAIFESQLYNTTCYKNSSRYNAGKTYLDDWFMLLILSYHYLLRIIRNYRVSHSETSKSKWLCRAEESIVLLSLSKSLILPLVAFTSTRFTMRHPVP